MADLNSHLKVADRNQKLIDHLIPTINDHSEWVVVVAFYRALHLVDALLFHDMRAHGGDHHNRNNILKRNNKYKHIFIHYQKLYRASKVARYLEVDSVEVNAFSEYMSTDQVLNTVLKDYLKQIENSVTKLMKPKK